jgi:non-specific serine/threonine protein kinase
MIGQTISHYKILEKLGEGGMGVVYKAQDTKLKRTVALKFLSPQAVGTDDDKARFIHEAQAAAALNHNNICTIYEIDEAEGGQTFIAMEYVEGECVKDRLASGPVDVDEALDIATRAAEGLGEAHEKGIIHRDVKSANVMLTKRGQAKVMDFGLAMSPGKAQITRTGTTVGTVAYMSPEQARGGEVDQRSDIWSLGVMLYEMVSGQLPFKGDHEQAVMYSIMNEEPALISSVQANVPAGLDTIVQKCLAKDPPERYQTAAELTHELHRLRSVSERRSPQHNARHKNKTTNWWPWLMLAVVVVIAVNIIRPWLFPSSDPQQSSEKKMLVVLPFENLGPPEEEYFADGITEELTARLARIDGLGVIARTSAVQYKSTAKTLSQIGDELNVEYVLEGTIRWERVGDRSSRIRVTPQLIRVSDATHLWADIYQRDMTGIFEVQTDIAEQVAAALNIELLDAAREAIEDRPTENLEAYNAYLQGKDIVNGLDKRLQTHEYAVQMLERAVALDPEFSSAYAQLSLAHSGIYNHGYDRTDKRVASSKAAVDRALELEPDNAEAHVALAYHYYWCHYDYDLALEHFAVAEKEIPNDPDVLKGVAYILRRKGQYEDAVAKLKTALEFSPKDADAAQNIGETLAPMRRYEEAEKYYKLSIALDPGQNASYHYLGWNYRHWKSDTVEARKVLESIVIPDRQRQFSFSTQCIFERDYKTALDHLLRLSADEVSVNPWWFTPRDLQKGLVHRFAGATDQAEIAFEAARIQLETIIAEQPNDARMYSSLGLAYAGLGRKEDAIRAGKRATELVPVSKDAFIGPERMKDLAVIYTMVGEYEAALDTIEYLLSIPSYMSLGLLHLDPRYDPLRDHPRYEKLTEVVF